MNIPFFSKFSQRNSNAPTNNYEDPDLTGGINNTPFGAIADANYSGFPVENDPTYSGFPIVGDPTYSGFPIVGDPSMPDTTGGDSTDGGITYDGSTDASYGGFPVDNDPNYSGFPIVGDPNYSGFPIVGDPSMPDTTDSVVTTTGTDGSPTHFDPPQPEDSVGGEVVSISDSAGSPILINHDSPDANGGDSTDGGATYDGSTDASYSGFPVDNDATYGGFPTSSDYTYPPSSGQDTSGAIGSDVTSDYDGGSDGVWGGVTNDSQDPGGDGTATDNQTSHTNTDPLNISENGGNVDTTS